MSVLRRNGGRVRAGTHEAGSLPLEDGARVGVGGGGPAGSLFSIFLLRLSRAAGLDVAVEIHEPRRFEHRGPAGCNHCGGVVSESLVQALAAEGVNLPDHVIQRGIDSYVLHVDVGTVRIDTPLYEKRIAAVFRGNGPRESEPTNEASFDRHLLDLAVALGATVVQGLVADLRRHDGLPRVVDAEGRERSYDLLALACGVNSRLLDTVGHLGLRLRRPELVRTFITELHVGHEAVRRALGSSMHVFLLDLPRLEFAALIPKGDFVTACLLGDDIDDELVSAFLGAEEVRACFPGGVTPAAACHCFPRINVRGAWPPYADRVVLLGDCGVTRLYKDGIGAAYRAAKTAAATAVLHGISARDFERHYAPACRSVARDNAVGRLLFACGRAAQHSRLARRALLRMVAAEQALASGPRRLSALRPRPGPVRGLPEVHRGVPVRLSRAPLSASTRGGDATTAAPAAGELRLRVDTSAPRGHTFAPWFVAESLLVHLASPSGRAARPATLSVACLLTLFPQAADARHGEPPLGLGRPEAITPLSAVAALELPFRDAVALRAEDDARPADGPSRFAEPIAVRATPATSGTWDELSDSGALWRLRVHSPGATDLNLGFTRCVLPSGATLHVWSEADDSYRGPYTAADNRDHEQLWTPVLPGDRVVIELRLPPGPRDGVALELGHVGHGFRDWFGRHAAATPKSGACNIDVACPEGDAWRDDIDSAAVYSIDGFLSCSGTMVADVPRSFRPFFLTANHCGVRDTNASTVVVYWNYQASSCRGPRDGSLADSQSGATFRARLAGPDACLIELDAMPDPSWSVYWAGWDRSDVPPTGSVGIHHPDTDEKAITFNDDPLAHADSCIGGGRDSHWFVDDYEQGTTEPGSSGSGLWDPGNHRLIGVLSGGAASCTVIDYDCYGRFAQAWDAGAAPDQRLRDWLDPDGSGATTVPGGYPGTAPCVGEEIASRDLRVAKGAGEQVVLTWPAVPLDACVLGVQVRMSATAWPASPPGSFPADPPFLDVTGEDADAGSRFAHVPPPGAQHYLVVQALADGSPGPAGHYGR